MNEASRCVYCVCITGKHYVYLDNITASVRLHREAAQRLYMAPSLAFTSLETSAEDYIRKFHTRVERLSLIDTCIVSAEFLSTFIEWNESIQNIVVVDGAILNICFKLALHCIEVVILVTWRASSMSKVLHPEFTKVYFWQMRPNLTKRESSNSYFVVIFCAALQVWNTYLP